MLIIILGQKGHGKTLTVVREIMNKCKGRDIYTNFSLKSNAISHIKKQGGKFHRLKMTDLILPKTKEAKAAINWAFWKEAKEKKKVSIFLDEFHNVMNSRSGMSLQNKLMSNWLSQIRRILNDDPTNHLYLVSQRLRRIDINSRELADVIIECKKRTHKKKTLIFKYYYASLEDYDTYHHTKQQVYIADHFFKFYDTSELVDFGDESEGYV